MIDQVNGTGSVFGSGLQATRSNLDGQSDDYDMMSVGVKVYDDGVTNNGVERRIRVVHTNL